MRSEADEALMRDALEEILRLREALREIDRRYKRKAGDAAMAWVARQALSEITEEK